QASAGLIVAPRLGQGDQHVGGLSAAGVCVGGKPTGRQDNHRFETIISHKCLVYLFSKFTSQFGDCLNTSFFCATPKGHFMAQCHCGGYALKRACFWGVGNCESDSIAHMNGTIKANSASVFKLCFAKSGDEPNFLTR